jgi:ethanolamine utilization protein EutN
MRAFKKGWADKMRIAKVIGSVTLSRQHETLTGSRYKIIVPLSLSDLAGDTQPSAEPLITYDDLGASDGELIAFTEGGEATQPFQPKMMPIDAYNAAILDQVHVNRLPKPSKP